MQVLQASLNLGIYCSKKGGSGLWIHGCHESNPRLRRWGRRLLVHGISSQNAKGHLPPPGGEGGQQEKGGSHE